MLVFSTFFNDFYKVVSQALSSIELDEYIHLILAIELGIIIFASIMALSLKKITTYFNNKDLYTIKMAIRKFQLIANQQTSYHFKFFTRSERSLPILLEVLKYCDKNKSEFSNLKELRKEFYIKMLLPTAIKYANSSSLSRRALALKCFMQSPQFISDEIILKLFDDRIPILRLGAARLAIQVGNPRLVNRTIKFCLEEKRFVRNFTKAAATQASHKFITCVRARLNKEKDPYIQKICLDLLANHLNKYLDSQTVLKLLETDHKELKLSVLRSLAFLKLPQTMRALKFSLRDSSWEVRALAARLLGQGKYLNSQPELERVINDSAWWVRRNSGMALLELGVRGRKSLLALKNHQDPYVRDSADHALSIEELERLKKQAA
jgi:HEAT repeat protein